LWSLVVGVAHCLHCMASGVPIPFPLIPLAFTRALLASKVSSPSPSLETVASGVAHCLAESVNVVPECLPLSVEYPEAPEDLESPAVAVGQNEDSPPSMGRSNVACSKSSPLSMEPEVGQRPEKSSESSRPHKPLDVLHDDEGGFQLASETEELIDEVSLVSVSPPFAGLTVGLTGDATEEEIDIREVASS